MRSGALTARANSVNLPDYARAVIAECDALPSDRIEMRHFALPFVDVFARFTNPDYAANCDKSLVQRRSPANACEQVTLTVADAEAEGISAPASWGETCFLPLEVERSLGGSNLRGSYFYDSRIWEFYDLDRRRGASIAPARGAYPPWERSAPLRTLLHWVYLGMGLRLVHAATLGAEGRGVLIAGGGGAGKSGLTLAGILAGLDSVGDDYVLVDPRGRPTAYPVFRVAKQDEAGCRRLGLSRHLDDLGPPNWQGKHEFDFERLGRGRRVEFLSIEAILVPTLCDRPDTEITPAGARNAMLALAPSGILQLPGDRRTGARTYAELVRKLPCYRIEIGSDPDAAAGAIAEFLEKRAAA